MCANICWAFELNISAFFRLHLVCRTNHFYLIECNDMIKRQNLVLIKELLWNRTPQLTQLHGWMHRKLLKWISKCLRTAIRSLSVAIEFWIICHEVHGVWAYYTHTHMADESLTWGDICLAPSRRMHQVENLIKWLHFRLFFPILQMRWTVWQNCGQKPTKFILSGRQLV